MHVCNIWSVSFRSENNICNICFINFGSKTAYMWYMILGLDLKLFWDHKPLFYTIKSNLKIIFRIWKIRLCMRVWVEQIKSNDQTIIKIID